MLPFSICRPPTFDAPRIVVPTSVIGVCASPKGKKPVQTGIKCVPIFRYVQVAPYVLMIGPWNAYGRISLLLTVAYLKQIGLCEYQSEAVICP